MNRRVRSALLLAGALFVISACTPELSRDELLARAATAAQAGDLAAAEIDIKAVLQGTPEDAAARRLYGDIYRLTANPVAAVEQYDRSLRSEEHAPTRLWLAKTLPSANESGRLIEDWQSGRFVTVESKAGFQAALARAMLAEARPEDARASVDRALASVQGDAEEEGYVEVTAAYVDLQLDNDLAGAEERLSRVIDNDPGNAEAQSLLGLLARQAGDFEAAEQFYSAAIEADPYRLGDKVSLVEAQIRLGKGDVADGTLATLERQAPKNIAVNMLRAQLLFDDQEFEEAVNIFNQVLSIQPTHLAALLLSANANLRLEKYSVAATRFEDYLSLRPGDTRVMLQLGQIYALLGRPQDTEAMARSVLEIEDDNTPAATLLANALSAQGLHVESAEVLAELTRRNPESTVARVALGSQQLVAGDVEAGLAELETAVENDAGSELAKQRLIEARLAVGDLSGAQAVADAWEANDPESVAAAVYRGRVSLQQGDNSIAESMFTKALNLDPGNVPASGGIAAVAVLNGDLPAARTAFEQALEKNPGDAILSLNLAVVQEQLGELDAVESTLTAAVKANPQALEARLALARLYLERGESGAAISMLQPAMEDFDKDYRLHEVLTSAYLTAGDPDLASGSADRLLELRPGNPTAQAIGARVALSANEAALAEERARQAMLAFPDNTELRRILIDALVGQGLFDDAVAEIEKLPQEARDEAPVQALLGRIAMVRGSPADAKEFFARALSIQPNPATLVMLAEAEWTMGEREAAMERQRQWLTENPDDEVVRRAYADKLILSGDEDLAMAEYRRLADILPDDVQALNNLAWLLRESDNARALELAEKADKLAPDNAQVKDTYAMVEGERGEFTRALRLNQRALELSDSDPDIQLNRARLLIQAERGADAEAYLNRLIADPDFPATAKAEAESLVGLL